MTKSDKYVRLVLDNIPDVLGEADIIKIMGVLLTSFAEGPHEASKLLTVTHRLSMQYYADIGAECMCDDCIADRKANSH